MSYHLGGILQTSSDGDTAQISEAAKQKASEAHPTALSVAGNFLGGLFDGAKSTVKDLVNVGLLCTKCKQSIAGPLKDIGL